MAKPWKIVDPHGSRAYTCAVLELVDEGMFSRTELIENLLSWMSEDDVRQFCQKNLRDEDNECLIREDDLSDEDVEAIMDDYNYPGNKSHY